MPRQLPVITRLNSTLEQREYHAARARGAKLLLGYFIFLGIVVWSVLSR